jgi:hypothetical protein
MRCDFLSGFYGEYFAGSLMFDLTKLYLAKLDLNIEVRPFDDDKTYFTCTIGL